MAYIFLQRVSLPSVTPFEITMSHCPSCLAADAALAQLAAGNTGPLGVFFESQRPRLIRIAIRMVGLNDAEDMVQKSYIGLLQWRPPKGCVEAWLTRCLKNCCIDFLRHQNLQIEILDPNAIAQAPAPMSLPFKEGFSEEIEKCLSSLNPIERFVIEQYYREGKTDKEIAAELRLTPARVGQIRKSALLKLLRCPDLNPFDRL